MCYINECSNIKKTIEEDQVNAKEEKEKINESFKEIDDFISNKLNIKLQLVDYYRFIIGESPYPNKNKIVVPYSNSKYKYENIPEVALLSYQFTLEMFTICSILFKSHQNSKEFINWILGKPCLYINYFAEYLFIKHKIILFNRYSKNNVNVNKKFNKKSFQNRDSLVQSLISKYQPKKILVIGKKSTGTFKKLVKGKSLEIIHSSIKALRGNVKEWCETYFCLDTKPGNLQITDFSL